MPGFHLGILRRPITYWLSQNMGIRFCLHYQLGFRGVYDPMRANPHYRLESGVTGALGVVFHPK